MIGREVLTLMDLFVNLLVAIQLHRECITSVAYVGLHGSKEVLCYSKSKIATNIKVVSVELAPPVILANFTWP